MIKTSNMFKLLVIFLNVYILIIEGKELMDGASHFLDPGTPID